MFAVYARAVRCAVCGAERRAIAIKNSTKRKDENRRAELRLGLDALAAEGEDSDLLIPDNLPRWKALADQLQKLEDDELFERAKKVGSADAFTTSDPNHDPLEYVKRQPIKIFYCSRTHSQLDQVVKELKNSPFKVRGVVWWWCGVLTDLKYGFGVCRMRFVWYRSALEKSCVSTTKSKIWRKRELTTRVSISANRNPTKRYVLHTSSSRA